ncbi:hypothetical protein PIB30_080516 [Stylosanthes scabra]|uniref:Uncharacterized protein n=1 Tax=Stylosanthes scabra TaxID=79078 RepID=A0ABU6VPW5_9FABA|nr:hypothetical protein [Stylosanthes scabra]
MQKKTEVQLGLLIKLATLIIETLKNSSPSRQEDEVLAVTLRSEKQLERPPLTTHHIPLEASKKVDIQHEERNTQDMPEAVTTNPQQTTTEDKGQTPLPYPTSTRRKRQAKTIDPQIVELLKNVEVTLPLLEVIRQIPECAKFLREMCTHKKRIEKFRPVLNSKPTP